jgi:fructose-1,6-bisphosphatase/inositol monophosphatase family enzyme
MNFQDLEYLLRKTAVAAACQLKARVMEAAAGGFIDSEVKGDGSRVTAIDFAVERTMGSLLRSGLTGFGDSLTIVGEEGTVIGNDDAATFVVFFDPTDGTALVRLLAPGSTTGCCLYDRDTRRFLAGVVADPWLERVLFAEDGTTYQQRFNVTDGTLLGEPVQCEVSEKSFADGGELLIEVAHGFKRNVFRGGKRSVFTQREITRFWGDTHTTLGTKVRMCSSNLMHQLLVASGGDAIATVMTAIGGPWDMSGVALVQGAGGAVFYLRFRGNKLQMTENPMGADLVICANSQDTVDQVFEVLAALRQ